MIRRDGTSYEGDGKPGIVLGYESVIKRVVMGNQAFGVLIRENCGQYRVEETGF